MLTRYAFLKRRCIFCSCYCHDNYGDIFN